MNLIIQNSLLFFAAILSGLLVFLFKENKKKTLKLLLTFSGAYLFSITVLSLLPNLYEHTSSTKVGLFILIGFLIQILLEYFSEGIEHGHIHIHNNKQNSFPSVMMISLCVHAFLEGMPIGGHHLHGNTNSLFAGILIHNIPISLALMSVLLESKISKTKVFLLLVVFSSMTPLGSIVAHLIGESNLNVIATNFYDAIMALVIGVFLHISTTILFETSENHRFNVFKFATIIAGCVIAFLTL